MTRKTGARSENFELPIQALVNLLEAGVSFHVASMAGDSRMVLHGERQGLLERLTSIHPVLIEHLGEEVVDPDRTTTKRLRRAGVKLEWPQ